MASNGSLDPIYERLNGADRYHPFTADAFSDWSMEAGDTITVTRDGHTYESPVHTSTLRWNGQPKLSVSSEGNESRDSVTRQTKSKYGRGGSGLRNDLAMRRYMSDIYGALTSSLELSESRLWLGFRGMYDGLRSDLEFTRSALQVEFGGMYDGLSSHFELTRSQMQVTFEGMYDGLSSEFLFTRSELRTEFRGLYDGLNSEFQVTRSELRAEFSGLYDGLSSEFKVTRSELRTEFSGLYDGLHGELVTTRSELRTEFSGLYDGLSSTFQITRSLMAVDFKGAYDGLSSEFQITRSQLVSEFNDTYNGLKSQIQQNANRIGLVVDGNGVKRASIVAAINGNTSSADIQADQISIGTDGSSVVHIGDVMGVVPGGISLGSSSIITSGDSAGFHGNSYGSFYYSEQQQGHSVYTGILKKAEVDGNTLKIWKFGDTDPSITFSKATTVTGNWSGTTYTATATPGPGTAQTSVHMGVDGATNPNETVYVKIYKDSISNANQIDLRELKMEEVASGKRVKLSVKVESSGVVHWLEKGSVSTAGSYTAGWNAGLAAIEKVAYNPTTQNPGGTAPDSQALVTKNLNYGEKYTIRVTQYNEDGTVKSVSRDTIQAPSSSYDDGYTRGLNDGYDNAAGAVLWNGLHSVNGSFSINAGESFVVTVPYLVRNQQQEVTERTTHEYTISCPALTTTSSYGWNGTAYAASASVNGNSILSAYTSVHLQVETGVNSDEALAKIYKDNPNDNTNLLTVSKVKLVENVSSKTVALKLDVNGNGSSYIEKASVSTKATYNAGYSNGYNADHGMFIAQINGSSYTEVQNVRIAPGGSVSLVPRFQKYNGTSYRTGRGAVVTANNLYPSGGWSKTENTLTNDNKLTVSLSSTGSLSELSYVISATAGIAYDESTHKYTASAVAKVDGTQRGETSTDVSGLEAYYAGKASVTINSTMEYTTAKSSSITATSNTLKVNTQNRTNASGESVQSTKTVNLYTESSSDGLTATFYVREGTNSADNRILKKTQTCSDANLVAGNIKSGVSIFGVTGSYAPSSTVIQPTGVTLSTQKANTLTWNFYVTTSNSSTGPFECDLTSVYNAGGQTAHVSEVGRGASYANKTQNQTLSAVEISADTTLYYRVRPRYGTNTLVDEANFFYFNQPLTYKSGGSTSYKSRNLYCSSVSPTYPGATTNYYYFRLEGNYDFSAGTNYTFYRSSWPTS